MIKEPFHVHLIVEQAAYDTLTGPMLEDYRAKQPQARANDILRHVLSEAVAAWRRHEPRRETLRSNHLSRMRVLARKAAEATDDQIERAVARLVKAAGAV